MFNEMVIGEKTYYAKNGRFYETFYNEIFLLLYHYNINYEGLFENDSEALKSNKPNKYSIIGKLNDRFKTKGKFEFILWYPKFVNHWRQSINPVHEKETDSGHSKNAAGYEPLHIGSTANYWGGLVYSCGPHGKGSDGSFLDGSTYHRYWCYSIAPFTSYDGVHFPAADSKDATECALWIRMPLYLSNNVNRSKSHVFIVLALILLIVS